MVLRRFSDETNVNKRTHLLPGRCELPQVLVQSQDVLQLSLHLHPVRVEGCVTQDVGRVLLQLGHLHLGKNRVSDLMAKVIARSNSIFFNDSDMENRWGVLWTMSRRMLAYFLKYTMRQPYVKLLGMKFYVLFYNIKKVAIIMT